MRIRNYPYVFIVFLSFITVSSFGVLMAAPDNHETYDGFFDGIIKKYDAKASLYNSSSQNIQRDAALACMKSAYYKTFKQELIKEMRRQNIKCCPHRIQYFLNQRFIDIVGSDKNRAIRFY